MGRQEKNKTMDDEMNQPRILTQGINGQAQIIILLQAYDMKTQLSTEGSKTRESGRREERMTAARRIDSVTMAMEVTVGGLERPS